MSEPPYDGLLDRLTDLRPEVDRGPATASRLPRAPARPRLRAHSRFFSAVIDRASSETRMSGSPMQPAPCFDAVIRSSLMITIESDPEGCRT